MSKGRSRGDVVRREDVVSGDDIGEWDGCDEREVDALLGSIYDKVAMKIAPKFFSQIVDRSHDELRTKLSDGAADCLSKAEAAGGDRDHFIRCVKEMVMQKGERIEASVMGVKLGFDIPNGTREMFRKVHSGDLTEEECEKLSSAIEEGAETAIEIKDLMFGKSKLPSRCASSLFEFETGRSAMYNRMRRLGLFESYLRAVDMVLMVDRFEEWAEDMGIDVSKLSDRGIADMYSKYRGSLQSG